MEHDRVAVAGPVAVLAGAIDGIDGEHPLALLGESAEIARRFLGLDSTAANDRAHVAQRGDQDLLHRQVRERERVGVRGSGVLSGERDIVPAKLTREGARPADGARQLRRQELEQIVHAGPVRRG